MALVEIATIVTGRVVFEAVFGESEETATVEPFESFELAHAYVLKKKDEGFAVAFARETPIDLIEDAAAPSEPWPHHWPRFSGVNPEGWRVLGPDTDDHPDVGPDHPLRVLAALIDRDMDLGGDPDPGALLADIGTDRLARLLVMCAAMLDPGQAREALAEARSLARTMAGLARPGRAELRKVAKRD